MSTTASSASKPSGGWQPPTLEDMQAMLPQYQFVSLLGRGGNTGDDGDHRHQHTEPEGQLVGHYSVWSGVNGWFFVCRHTRRM